MDDIFLQLSKLTSTPDPTDSGSASNKGDSGTSISSSGSISDGLITDDEEMFVYDELVTPDIKPKRSEGDRRTILVIDDDFPTLDLMKIYLQRSYDYVSFDNPKDAVFWLNTHVPDLIFMDCYLTLIKSKRVVEIIRSYKEIANVPIFYLSEPAEMGAVGSKLPAGVLGVISRPVGRGDLQGVLNFVFQDAD